MKAHLFSFKMVCKLVALFTVVGAITAFIPAPRFTAEAQGLKNAIVTNPDLEPWSWVQQNSGVK